MNKQMIQGLQLLIPSAENISSFGWWFSILPIDLFFLAGAIMIIKFLARIRIKLA